jgi:hypothetical protein
MAGYLSRIVAVSVGINTTGTYLGGTSPNMSSCIHQFRNTTPMALDTNSVNLQELRGSMSKSSDAVGRQLYRLTPGLCAMGIGSATFLPGTTNTPKFRLGKILRMCGMSESASDGQSSLRYSFRSTGFEDGLIECQLADTGSTALLYKMYGVFGTFTMAGSAGQVITIDPTLTGRISAQPAVVTAIPAASLPFAPAGNTAQTMKSENLSITTGDATVLSAAGAGAVKFKSFSLDVGVDVQEDPDANAADALYGLLIAGRSPTLQLTIGADSASIAKFHADLNSGAIETISFLHGSGVGKYMQVTMTGQLTGVVIADDVGLRTLQLTYNLAVGTNLDETELYITFS